MTFFNVEKIRILIEKAFLKNKFFENPTETKEKYK